MAKQYYTMEEALQALGMTEVELKQLVRDGQLREFRHGGQLHFKVDDIRRIAGQAPSEGSATGELTLMPSDDSLPGLSGTDLMPPGDKSAAGLSGSDILALADQEPEPGGPKKDDTVVTSVGISVFDDDDLELDADPMAKTVLSDSEGEALGGESTGSGSGLLDLTRESDDTSLGAELLDEIYSDEDEAQVQMGDATRAGLVQEAAEEEELVMDQVAAAAPVAYREIEDASSPAFTALLIIGTLAMGLVGGVVAAIMRDAWPSYLSFVSANIIYFAGGAAVVAVIVSVVGVLMGKKASGRETVAGAGGS